MDGFEFAMFVVFCAWVLLMGVFIGVVAVQEQRLLGTQLMAPCIQQGYTKEHCFDTLMDELNGE